LPSPREEEETVTITPTLSPQGRGSLKGRVIHRERKIKEKVFHRVREA
jgi:hypothetical protein